MAQIDTNISDMPWLGAMDRGALARGVQSGATIANLRNQRAALAQRKFEFEREQMMREAQERRAQALMPLQMTVMDQERRMNELKLTTALESRNDYLNNEKDILQLNQNIARAFSETDNGYANSIVMMRDALAKNPKLVNDPRFVEQRKILDDSLKLQSDLAISEARARNYMAEAEAFDKRLQADAEQERRLREKFEWDKEKAARELPPQDLAAFRADSKVITDDWRLKYEDKVKRLEELKVKYGISPRQPTISTNQPQAETIGRFKVIRE